MEKLNYQPKTWHRIFVGDQPHGGNYRSHAEAEHHLNYLKGLASLMSMTSVEAAEARRELETAEIREMIE